MPPDGDAVLRAFTSGDAHLIWTACGDVMALPDGDALATLAASIEQIKTATAPVDLGGRIVSNRVHLDTALLRLRLYRDRLAGGDPVKTCYCALLTQTSLMSPEMLAQRGRGVIGNVLVLNEEYTTLTDVTCPACGSLWQSREEIGWHIPTYKWTRQRKG